MGVPNAPRSDSRQAEVGLRKRVDGPPERRRIVKIGRLGEFCGRCGAREAAGELESFKCDVCGIEFCDGCAEDAESVSERCENCLAKFPPQVVVVEPPEPLNVLHGMREWCEQNGVQHGL